MRALVIGGDGFLGVHLVAALQKEGHQVTRSSRKGIAKSGVIFLDLAKQIPALPAESDVVFLVAAASKFQECEGRPESWIVNVDAPIEIARKARAMGAFPVFVSSDAVEWCGSTAYARQKAQTELAVLLLGGGVVRPSRIVRERVDELCALMIKVGTTKASGVHRWQ